MFRQVWINNKLEWFFFCDICGQLVKYDENFENSYKETCVPFISHFRITKNNEMINSMCVGIYHFHNDCFDKLKNGEITLIKRKTNKYGREHFTNINNTQKEVIKWKISQKN